MSGNQLKELYSAYKKDTDKFATWLVSQAKRLGVKIILKSQPEDERARKDIQDVEPGKKNHVLVKDFERYAEAIANSRKKPVTVPGWVFILIDSAIAGRTKYSQKLDQLTKVMGLPLDIEGDHAHAHFIEVLGKVREILKTREDRRELKAKGAKSSSRKNNNNTNNTNNGQSAGKFMGLHVHDPSEEFLNAPDVNLPTAAASKEPLYKAEMPSSKIEAVMEYRALLKELNDIRSFIRDVWENYLHGTVGLVPAALATNTALDLARYFIEKKLPSLEPHGGPFVVAAWDFYFKIHQSEEKIQPPWEIPAIDLFEALEADIQRHHDGLAEENMMHPIHYCFIMFRHTSSPSCHGESLLGPAVELLMLGEEASTRPQVSRYQEDEAILHDYLMIMIYRAKYFESFPGHDEVTQGMTDFLNGTGPEFPIAVATQVLLDVSHVIKPNPLQHFREWKSSLESLERQCMDFKMRFIVGPVEKMLADAGISLLKTHQNIQFILDDSLHKTMLRKLTMTKDLDYFAFKKSPVLCGLILFFHGTEVYESATWCMRKLGCVACVAHIYNMCLEEGLLDRRWQNMETLIDHVIGEETFFRSGRPNGRKEYAMKLYYATGMPLHRITLNRSSSRGWTRRGWPKIEADTPVLEKFRKRFLGLDARKDWHPAELAQQLEATKCVERVHWRDDGQDLVLVPESYRGFGAIPRTRQDDEATGNGNGNSPGRGRGKGRGESHKKRWRRDMEVVQLPQFHSRPGEPSIHQLLRTFVLQISAENFKQSWPLLDMHMEAWDLLWTVYQACLPVMDIMTYHNSSPGSSYCDLPMAMAGALTQSVLPPSFGLPRVPDERMLGNTAKAINGWFKRGNGDKFPLRSAPIISRMPGAKSRGKLAVTHASEQDTPGQDSGEVRASIPRDDIMATWWMGADTEAVAKEAK